MDKISFSNPRPRLMNSYPDFSFGSTGDLHSNFPTQSPNSRGPKAAYLLFLDATVRMGMGRVGPAGL
jgi:hypothetical protein